MIETLELIKHEEMRQMSTSPDKQSAIARCWITWGYCLHSETLRIIPNYFPFQLDVAMPTAFLLYCRFEGAWKKTISLVPSWRTSQWDERPDSVYNGVGLVVKCGSQSTH